MAEPTTRARQPKRPAHLPHGRWLGDLEPLSAFERKLVAACARGEVCEPDGWDGKRPEEDAATEANTVRAELIRFLALGGDDEHPVHEQGVMLGGGWIKGKLSLHQATAMVRLYLAYCHFDRNPDFVAASLPELTLSGSQIPGIWADRLVVKGGVWLNNGFETSGEVRLLAAQIGGNLSCVSGKFFNRLIADGMIVRGNVFLSDGFEASGAVSLLGAQIAGDLVCRNGVFSSSHGIALNADGMDVKGGVFLLDASIEGGINLTAARIVTLVDDATCWQSGGHILDGFVYDRIIGPSNAEMRVDWLMGQREDHLTSDFRYQPWDQLIKMLREVGAPYEASRVAIAKQNQLRVAKTFKQPVYNALHWLFGRLTGYGYDWARLLGAMIWLWLGCAFFFSVGGDYGYVGPSTPLLYNPELAPSIDDSCGHAFETGKQVWTKCANMPAEYTTFQPLLYSLDLILPLVDLQQESDWAPIVEEAPGVSMAYGVFLRWLMWFEILFGWMASLMLVAILGQLVDKD